MRVFMVVLCLFVLTGCGSLSYEGLVDTAYGPFSETIADNSDGKMGIDLVSEPTVKTDGTVRIFARFKRPSEAAGKVSLQEIDIGKGWVGQEAHDLPMLIPDIQSRTTSNPGAPHVRKLRVRPGDVSGVEWTPIKRVTMIEGFPEDGSFNRLWFQVFEQGGEITLDEMDRERLWGWEWIPATEDHDGRLRIWVGESDDPEWERLYDAE